MHLVLLPELEADDAGIRSKISSALYASNGVGSETWQASPPSRASIEGLLESVPTCDRSYEESPDGFCQR